MTVTDERLRALMARVADLAPMPSAFEDIGTIELRPSADARSRGPILVGVGVVAGAALLAGVAATRNSDELGSGVRIPPSHQEVVCGLVSDLSRMTDESLVALVEYFNTEGLRFFFDEQLLRNCSGDPAQIDRFLSIAANKG